MAEGERGKANCEEKAGKRRSHHSDKRTDWVLNVEPIEQIGRQSFHIVEAFLDTRWIWRESVM